MKHKLLIFCIIVLSVIFCNKVINAQDAPAQEGQPQNFLDEYDAKKYLEKGTEGNFEPVNGGAKAGDDSIYAVIGRAIEMVLSLVGIILIIIIIYSGYLWFSADGNEDQITTAKSHIINAAFGVAVVFLAYAITSYVMAKLGEGLIK
ncbi:MAG: hypothetical protein V1860_03315 [bacterium]